MRIKQCSIPRGDTLTPDSIFYGRVFKYQTATILQLRLTQCGLILLHYFNRTPRDAELLYAPRATDLIHAYQALPDYRRVSNLPGTRFKLNHMASPMPLDNLIDWIDQHVIAGPEDPLPRAANALFAIMSAFRSVDARLESDGSLDKNVWGYGTVSYRIDHLYRELFNSNILGRQALWTENDIVESETALHIVSLMQTTDWYEKQDCLLGFIRNEIARKVRRMILGDPGANPTYKKPFSELEAVQAANVLETVLQMDSVRKQFVRSTHAREAYHNEILAEIMQRLPILEKRVFDPQIKRELALFTHNLLPVEKRTANTLSINTVCELVHLFDGRRDQALYDGIRDLIGRHCTSRPELRLEHVTRFSYGKLLDSVVWPHISLSQTRYNSERSEQQTTTRLRYTSAPLQIVSDPYLNDDACVCEGRFAPGVINAGEALLIVDRVSADKHILDQAWIGKYTLLCRKQIERNLAHLQYLSDNEPDEMSKDEHDALRVQLEDETLNMLATGIQYNYEVRATDLHVLFASQLWVDEFGNLSQPIVHTAQPSHGDFVKEGSFFFTFERVSTGGWTLSDSGPIPGVAIPPELFMHGQETPLSEEYLGLYDDVDIRGIQTIWVEPQNIKDRTYLRVGQWNTLYSRMVLSNPDVATLMRFPNTRWSGFVLRRLSTFLSPLFAHRLDIDKQFRDTTRMQLKKLPSAFMKHARLVPAALREALSSLETIDDNLKFYLEHVRHPGRFALLEEWLPVYLFGDLVGEYYGAAISPVAEFAPGVPNPTTESRGDIRAAGLLQEVRQLFRSYVSNVALSERDNALRI